jgi:hypothetical protein
MRKSEISHLFVAVLILFVVIGFQYVIRGNPIMLIEALAFSLVLVFLHVVAKKIAAYLLDADVEHRVWSVYRYGYKARWHFKREIPFGIAIPLLFTAISLGFVKFMGLLTYETRVLKIRAAKRFGQYSYTEMSEWHNGLIGAAGIVALLFLAVIAYFFPQLEYLSKLSVYYAFWNLLPISDLDGTQIFFGSRILWATLALITAVFTAIALII